MLSVVRDVSEIKRSKELQSQLGFERLMSSLSKTFINLPVDQVDGEVSNGLARLAEALDLDSIVITQTDVEKESRTFTHSWRRPGLPAAPSGSTNEVFPWLASRISQREICSWSAIEDMPEEVVAERKHVLAVGLKSWLTIPLVVGGELIGSMAAAMFRQQRTWDSLFLARFQQAAEIFANALARKRMVLALRESREEKDLALDSAGLGVWGWTSQRDKIWASEQTRKLFGWPPGADIDFVTSFNSVHPDDRVKVRRLVEQAMSKPGDCLAEFRLLRPDGSIRWIRSLGRSYATTESTVDRFMGASLDITERKRNEEALKQQLTFETLRAELSATFINLAPDQVDAQIRSAQKRICDAMGLDRSALAQIHTKGDEFRVTHSWAAEGFEPNPLLPVQRHYPWYARMILAGTVIRFTRLDDLPEEAVKEKEMIRRYGPKSSIIFPLMAGGKVFGAVAFGTMREEREWPSSVAEQLSLLAEVFANALARKRSNEELQTAYSEIEQLKKKLEQENLYLREEIKLDHTHHEVIGGSDAIRRVLKKAEQVATTDATVLLLGETGTGKELIARAIHESSKRKNKTMVKVNCAALPSTLIESELFGRERGAYTGALTREIGRFELANGSTIFLDEIGELPLDLQAKLLRVLQEGEFERLGSPKTIRVDVRVVAATARDLEAAIKEGKFREDLFYRLNVFPIKIPPLRERPEDIPPLVWHFVNELGPRMGRRIESIQAQTMEAFKKHPWPGNVRELRNLVERFLITNTDTVFRGDWQSFEKAAAPPGQTIEEIERSHIVRVLESTSWHIRGRAGAAETLGMKPTTLESRMHKLGIARPK